MSDRHASLPAYLRLPDGLRFAGSTALGKPGELLFSPKQAIATLPPAGLPVHLVIVGIPGDDDEQFDISGMVERATTRELAISLEDQLPYGLLQALDPDAATRLPGAGEGQNLLQLMRDTGSQHLTRSMRRFLVDLGDQLFDLSTSSRHGMAGQHTHYDALNKLKRGNQTFIETFSKAISESLDKTEKEGIGQSFADLEAATARSLDLVALEEMDQKLAIDKIVGALIDEHRVGLECLTIRAATVANVEPGNARTPFHPVFIVQAFVDAFAQISDEPAVMKDALEFFRLRYTKSLEKLYPTLNKLFIDANIKPGLESEVLEQGSLLNPVQKQIVKSTERTSATDDDSQAEPDEKRRESAAAATEDRAGQAAGSGAAAQNRGGAGQGAAHNARAEDRGAGEASRGSRRPSDTHSADSRHDAMYEAVLNALQTQRQAGAHASAARAGSNQGMAEVEGSSVAGPSGAAPAAQGSSDAGREMLPPASQEQLLSILQRLQSQQPSSDSLADLPSLEDVISGDEDGQKISLDQEGASRLGFVDNVFRTLHNNFEVSPEMAPSLSRLRVPLARLSLQEPRFFAQPEHPAHQLLDKLSNLAGADHNVSRSLQKKVDTIVDGIVSEYDDDSSVFDDAQRQLDGLLGQRDRVLERNIQRVVSGLEGQEKLSRAQRRVELLVDEHIDQENAPKALLDLLEGGWRSALVQLALREGEDSFAWREEAALLEKLVRDFGESSDGNLPEAELREMQHRLRALNRRLNVSNPGSVAHESALHQITAVLQGRAPADTAVYQSPLPSTQAPDPARVANLPRLRRWLTRVAELEMGTRLRYSDKDGRKRQMKLVWTSEEKDRFVFVNERGQKVADLTAVQLARQLSRGATPPSDIDTMSVVDQSVYETLEQAQKTLSFDRNRDSLTQLINEESLVNQLKRSLRHAQARGSEHAFMLLNIDRFSLVNEVFDDTSGDQVLSDFAKLLAQLNDRRTLTARMQGDEFGILMTYRGSEEARQLAERIRKDIAESTLSVGDESVSFTVSMGITAIVQASDSTDSVLAQARAALELAKSHGRDQVVVFDVDKQELLDYKREKDESRKKLDDAMSTDGLVLRAQPIVQSTVDGSEGARHHYEVLLSLRGEDGKLTSPQDFIVSAERFGFVTMVDRWVLNEVFTWISELVDAQKEVPELSINLSGTSITDNDFLDYVLEQISEFGIGTSRLCFEITETGAIDNLPKAADFVRTLKNIGCKFSLDDFGTGLASHKYLRELPVDYVKIDGTFITDIHKNPTDYAMTKSISDLAHFLGQKTVAECVEDLDIVPALREIGIDYLQGWGIGMPRELPEIMDELDNIET